MNILFCLKLLFGIAVGGLAVAPALSAEVKPDELMKVDMRSVVSHNDVVYLSPCLQGWDGLPLGNGTLGAQAWQPDGLMFQLNTPLSTAYGRGVVRLHLSTMPTMFAGMQSYRQRLSLYDASLYTDITTRSGEIHACTLIPAATDGMVIQYFDNRTGAVEGYLELEACRPPATRKTEPDTKGSMLLLIDEAQYPGEPDYRFAVAVSVEGAATYPQLTPSTVCLHVPGKKFIVWLAFAGTRNPKEDPAALAKAKLATLRKRGFAAVQQTHAQWWSEFWKKSFIKLTSNDGVADYIANLWYMHIYALGAGSRGEMPLIFGGLWHHDYDRREWGPPCYWHWNTLPVYWPVFASNHLELAKPYLDMYWNMLPTVRKWTKEFWEVDGAQYQETIAFNGTIPDKSDHFTKVRGIHPRLPSSKEYYNTNLILSSSAEIAMQFWWTYLYTGDEVFLREKAYPLMKAVGTFYANYLERDKAGQYNMYPSNAQETRPFGVKNPTTDLAAIRYLFPILIDTGKRLNLDADLRPVWQDRLDHVAPYSIDPANGAILRYDPSCPPPVVTGQNPEMFPVAPFPMMTLGSPQYELGLKTFYARKSVLGYGWNMDSIIAARLGLSEPAPGGAPSQQNGLQWLLQNHAEQSQTHSSGLQDYYNRRPAYHIYLDGSGPLATAVGEMLLQSWNGLIRIAPALPRAWSGDFKLLAAGGFEVSGHAAEGKVKFALLASQRGQGAAVVNPFDAEAIVTCDRAVIVRSAAKELRFPTTAGKTYLLAPAGTPLLPTQVTARPNQSPKHLSPSSRRWIGIPAW